MKTKLYRPESSILLLNLPLINGMHTGFDKWLDRGIDGFQRYTSMAILSRKIQIIAMFIGNQQREELKLQQQAA